MNSDQIRKTFIKDIADSLLEGESVEQQTALAIMGCGRALVEIAAQLAELNHRMECMLDVQTRGLKE